MNSSQISNCGIYLITNKRNNLKYVGQSKNIKKRIREHFSKCFAKTALIDAAIAAEPDNFTWEILELCPIEDLNYYEIYYIYYFDSMNHGYNRDFGGVGSYPTFYGEQHHSTYYTNDEVLEMRKMFVTHSIQEVYDKYKKGQSFYTFKAQLLSSYSNLPIYHKKDKEWKYPPNYNGEIIKIERASSISNISEDTIMEVRRLSVIKNTSEIIHERGLTPFKSEQHLNETIKGRIYNWLPYYSQKEQKWIYPDGWTGKIEQEIDESNCILFFQKKEINNGRKLSNYQVLQIRLLASLGYSSTEILTKLGLNSICSKSAIKLIVSNKTYISLPFLSSNKKNWEYPDNLNQLQIQAFPQFIENVKKQMQIDKIIGSDE